MNTAVWKYTLPQGARPEWQEIEMPRYAGIVRVGQQNDVPVVWAVVSPEQTEMETVRLVVVPTGHEFDGHNLYLGTAELYEGSVVVHVFQEMPTIPDPPALKPIQKGDA